MSAMDAKAVVPWVLYAGLALAMVGGASWPAPRVVVVAAGLAVLGVGIAWKRRVDHARPDHEEGGARGSMAAAVAASGRLVPAVRGLVEARASKPLAELAEAIEEVRRQHLEPVVEAQDDVVRQRGFEAWAAVMAPLAGAERLLYRAWSAASDGHAEEARWSLEQAMPLAERAAEAAAAWRA